jgi:hypothetical protein
MDPFDEFEFKPLTDGLGFHKKAVSLKEGLKSSGVLDDELQSVPLSMPKSFLDETSRSNSKKHSFEDVLSALEKTPLGRSGTPELQFTEPLPREINKKNAMEMDIDISGPVNSPFPRQDAYRNPVRIPEHVEKIGKKIDEKNGAPAPKVGTRRGAADSPRSKLTPAPVSIPSAVLDGIIVFALSLVFLVALLVVTKVDLSVVLKNVNRDIMTQVSLSVLFISVMQMYVIISRSFFGRTLGEWTFDLQLGRDEEQALEVYPLRVALRAVVSTFTGLITLPLISALIGRDLAGQICGVQLYRQRL